MKKLQKHFVILLIAVFLFIPICPVLAADGELRDQGGPLERGVAMLVNAGNYVFEKAWDIGGFKTLDQLVFANNLSESQKDSLPWEPEIIPKLQKFYKSFSFAVVPFLAVAILVTAFRFLKGAVNPMERKEANESISRWFFAILIIILAPFFVSVLLKTSLILTYAIEHVFTGTISGQNISTLNTLSPEFFKEELVTGSYLGTAIVRLMFNILVLYFNALYIVRMVGITVMFLFTPLMAIMWAINRNVTAVGVWIGELASNAFMPVAHALVLCTILLLCDVSTLGDGAWFKMLVIFYTIIPLGEALRNSMQGIFNRAAGFSEEGTAGKAIAGVMGLGGALSVARVGRATMNYRRIPNQTPPTFSNKTNKGNMNPTKNGIKTTAPQRSTVTSKSGQSTANTGFNQMSMSGQNTKFNSIQNQTTLPKSNAKATVYRTPTTQHQTMQAGINKAAKAGQIAGAAVNIATAPAKVLAGAVPGGKEAVDGMSNLAKAGIAGATTATTTGVQLAGNYAKTRNINKAMERTTGTSNVKQGVQRIARTSARSATSPRYNNRVTQQYSYSQPITKATNKPKIKSQNGRYKVATQTVNQRQNQGIQNKAKIKNPQTPNKQQNPYKNQKQNFSYNYNDIL